ncbi:MAG: spondin domain-containing protein [Acidobacteriota bacterium]
MRLLSSKTLSLSALAPLALALAMAPAALAEPTQTAQYRVTFQANWSQSTHPNQFPGDRAHFSGLIGGLHNSSVTFWGPGQIATDGIENMAERGATSPFDSEIQAAINAGNASAVVRGGGIALSPGSASASFTANLNHPLLTLVSMVAPSPDWFVGVHDYSLIENGDWVQQRVIQLFSYDAGTDSGSNFIGSDINTNPPAPISLIRGGPLANGVPIGTFTISRQDTPPGPALELAEGRFKITATYRDFELARGDGQPVGLTRDTGFFWFFSPQNLEVVVKVVDGCGFNNHFWLFASGLTNVEVELRIEDTLTGQVNTYSNNLGNAFQPIQDTTAFNGCP